MKVDVMGGMQRNAFKIMVLKTEGGRDHSEDIGADGRIILKQILGKQVLEGVDWIYVPQGRDR
jgi:hypothetical protein